jgi:SAM-dependent methyltransferase
LKKPDSLVTPRPRKSIYEKGLLDFYGHIPGTFYDDLMKSRNPLRRWFHASRYKIIHALAAPKYVAGRPVLDIGAGSCCWNLSRLPVLGMDLNRELLEYGKSVGRLSDYRVGDIRTLDFPDKSFDLVVGAEILEHLDHADVVTREVYRVLKPNGYFIVSVPDDSGFSPWRILFPIMVFYKGFLLGDPYFRNRCGHVQHFSPARFEALLTHSGFVIEKFFSFWGLTLFAVARKPSDPGKNGT